MTSYTIVEAAEDAEIAGSAIKLHGPDGFAGMHTAGRLAAEVLDMLAPHVVPGVTTDELNRLAHDTIVAAGAAPAPLNYRGFPKSICPRSEEHTSELQSLMRISYAIFCFNNKQHPDLNI